MSDDDVQRIESGGVVLAARLVPPSDGIPILLIHGLGSSATGTWRASGWLRAVEAAGRGWIAPDLRGHGDSDRPHEPDSYQMSLLVDDVRAVLDHACAGVVDVVGYSLGARVAVEFAAAVPERVHRLVLGGFGDGSGARSSGSVRALLDRLPSGVDREAVAACVAGASAGDVRSAAGRVRAPVLLVAGDADDVAGDIEAAVGRFADARAVRLPGRNHFTAVSAAAFKQSALAFLAEGGR